MAQKDSQLKTLLGYGLLAFVGFQIFRAAKAGTQIGAQVAQNTQVITQTGISAAEMTLVRAVANGCHDAIWNSSQGTWVEDEDIFIAQLNKLTTARQAEAVSLVYATINGKSIAADMRKYLSNSEQSQIKAIIRNSLS